MNKSLAVFLMLLLAFPVMARSDGAKGGKGGYGGNRGNASQNNNPNSDKNCYYCWKDLNTQYTPSRHKYGKTQ